MSPAVRVRLAVGFVAVAAAGIVTGVVLATRQNPAQPQTLCKGFKPAPLVLPGVGKPAAVAAVRAAFAAWPRGTVGKLELLAQRYRHDPAVLFNYGRALQCRGYLPDAAQAYAAAKTAGRDTQYEIEADNALHPQFFQGGYPIFEPEGDDPQLVSGVLLQRAGHQHSAEKIFLKAARLHPNDAEAQVAAAVGRFDEDNLSASFSRLGPLARRFPRSQSLRYHLGLLLVWIGEANQGINEFKLARALGPHRLLGREANRLLRRLVANGSNQTQR
jgi:tetratricopeptide (TPR) repeat protein